MSLLKILAPYNRLNSSSLFLLFSFIVFFISLSFLYPTLEGPFISDRAFLCMDYIKAGILYANQPYCEQGPVLYYFFYFLFALFGDAFFSVLFFTAILLNLCILFLLRLIIEKETGKKYFFSLLFFYSLFIFFQFFSELSVTLSSLLFLSGLYFLLYSSYKYNTIVASFFFWFSLFTKFVVVVPLFLLLLYYFFSLRTHLKNNRSLLFSKALSLFCPFFLLTLVLLLRYHNALVYSALIHSVHPKGSYFYALSVLFDVSHYTSYSYVILFIILCSFFFLLEKFHYALFLSSFGLFLSLLKFLHVTARDAFVFFHYFHLYYLFFILAIYVIFSMLSDQRSRKLFFFVLFLFLLPFISNFYSLFSSAYTHNIIMQAGMDSLSAINGSYLIEDIPNEIAVHRYFPYLSLENKNFTFVNSVFSAWDNGVSVNVIRLIGVNYKNTFYNNSAAYAQYEGSFQNMSEHYTLGLTTFFYDPLITKDLFLSVADNIKNGTFDVIIIQHREHAINIEFIYDYALSTSLNTSLNYYSCSVDIPYTYGSSPVPLSSTTFLFKDTAACLGFQDEIYHYYKEHYLEICSIRPDIWKEIRDFYISYAINPPSCP